MSILSSEFKLTQFADDLTGLARDSQSLRRMISTIQEYKDYSGLALNMSKSLIMRIGDNPDAITQIAGLKVEENYQTLGVWFSSEENAGYDYEWNFLPILQKMKTCFNSWEMRSLSLKGKVVVANTLVLSSMQYMSSVIFTPRRVFEEAKVLTVEFLWGRGRSKIAYATLIQSTSEGGLKLADPETRTKVNLLGWVGRILSEPQSCPALFLQYLANTQDISGLLHGKPRRSPVGAPASLFYNAVLKTWIEYHSFPPEGELEIRNESLWHNRFIGETLQDPILRKRWKEAGIFTIHDLCHEDEGRLLSHSEIRDKFRVHCSFLEALQLRMAIPLHWRTSLSEGFQGEVAPKYNIRFRSGTTLPIRSTNPRRIYAELILAKKGIIRVQQQWATSTDVRDAEEWSEIYLRPFSAARETRLQSFQFRVEHRLITCNRLLFRYKIKQEDNCSYCDGRDTLEHFFYQCPISRRFWNLALDWFKEATGQSLSCLTLKEILLGVPRTFPQAKRANFLLLISRYFIHRQRLFHNGDLCVTHWTRELRKRLLTEKHICNAEGRPHKFAMWTSVMEYLG